MSLVENHQCFCFKLLYKQPIPQDVATMINALKGNCRCILCDPVLAAQVRGYNLNKRQAQMS